MITKQDIGIVSGLAKRVAEIAALPVMDERRKQWRALNALKPERPMFTIDQVCWTEMNVDDELTCRCEDSAARWHEWTLRMTLYRHKYFYDDTVIEPFYRVGKAVSGAGLGFGSKQTTLHSEGYNDIASHRYVNQIKTIDDVRKIPMPVVSHDVAETARRVAEAEELLAGALPVVEYGHDPYISVWDPVSTWMSVEGALYALIDQPEMMRALVDRVVAAYATMLDQLEAQGLLCHSQTMIHCTGAQSDELPAPGFDPAKPRAKDIWAFGLAQMFSTVSPEMFDEFEIEPNLRLLERFGLIYYGCCDPLDHKMKQVRKIKNCRKVSMSPWVNEDLGASGIAGDFVYSRKPNPAFLAWTNFDAAAVRADLVKTREICKREGCPLELILKDISTVKHEPRRLWEWARITREVVEG